MQMQKFVLVVVTCAPVKGLYTEGSMENFSHFTITISSAVKARDFMSCSVRRKSLLILSDLTGEWTNEQGGSPTHIRELELDGF